MEQVKATIATNTADSYPGETILFEHFNDQLCQHQKVRSTLWKQPNIQQYYHIMLMEKLRDDVSDNIAVADERQQDFIEQQRNHTVELVVASSHTF